MEYLPEICKSDFQHQKYTRVMKNYYQSNDKSLILCDECLTAWTYQQAILIASAIIQQFQACENQAPIVLVSEDDSLTSDQQIVVLPWMQKIFTNKFDLHVSVGNKYSDTMQSYTIFGTADIRMTITDGLRFNYHLNIDWYSLTINRSDILGKIANPISEALMIFIKGFMTVMDAPAIDKAMNLADMDDPYDYHMVAVGYTPGDCPCDNNEDEGGESGDGDSSNSDSETITHMCSICGAGLERPYYIYHNRPLCIHDMYAIVVDAAFKNNLTEQCDLARIYDGEEPQLPPTHYRRLDNLQWMMSVIDKYFLAVEGFDKVTKCYPIQ